MAAAGDAHFVAFTVPAAALVPSMLLAECAIVAHAQCRIPPAAPLGHHDDVVGIDDPQRLATAQRPRLDVELRRVRTLALDFDRDVAAGSGFDAQLADEVVDRDGIAFEDVT